MLNNIPDHAQFEADKRAVYKHPLFSLLAFLLEKCENATQGNIQLQSEGRDNNNDGKNVKNEFYTSSEDINEFVSLLQKEKRPLLTNNMELDNLMIKALQVLRIHILELEKVQELCRDFCNRYIACLRGKMQSENLLRSNFLNGECSDTNTLIESDDIDNLQNRNSDIYEYPLLNKPDFNAMNPQSSELDDCENHTKRVITNINLKSVLPLCEHFSDNSTEDSLDGIDAELGNEEFTLINNSSGCYKNKRCILPKQATVVMKTWLFQHIMHPYPTEEEKKQLSAQTNLTVLQVV
ncbi:PKNOX2 family protein [Megaselia abdita]